MGRDSYYTIVSYSDGVVFIGGKNGKPWSKNKTPVYTRDHNNAIIIPQNKVKEVLCLIEIPSDFKIRQAIRTDDGLFLSSHFMTI